ncbi:hypothetical protein JL101_030135 (plasmid) [Skermanella rosea]|uniref:transposase n=1 Tax=Skermanella rosea TaxID=1817965 RepID=UPI001932ABFA|nr:transposase [Skermanella rosea]UEM06755.1 hypothetical protein JL101_030135 [Skermanella rosea]
MGTAVRTATTSPASWSAFADVDAFVGEVLTELAAMAADGTRPTRSGPKPALTGATLRKAIMAIWCLCFCGMQWRAIGQLCNIPFNTLFTLFSRWTRLGLWRRLLDRLRRTWRLACGDTPKPSAVVIDSPLSLSASGQLSGESSCKSAPGCFERGFDGGKKIRGIKVHLGVNTRRAAKLITASRWRSTFRQPTCMGHGNAARRYTKGIIPVLRELSGKGFRGSALGDLGYRGKRLAKAGRKLGIAVEPVARGHDDKFLPAGICWVVERSFSWIFNHRRLNTIFERTKEHLVAFISILSRRIKRLVAEEVCA